MIQVSQKEQRILGLMIQRNGMQSSALYEELRKNGETTSLVTVKRTLSEMAKKGVLEISGSGRSTSYRVPTLGRICVAVDSKAYNAIDPDKRYGERAYNFKLLQDLPSEIFTRKELDALDSATAEYQERIKNLPAAIQCKELERLVIELSWKSSKIEGNTYTLLDTEKLILRNIKAPGHDAQEARMILNHKEAFQFIYEHREAFKTLSRANTEQTHSLLVAGMGVGRGLRKRPVGVMGSLYRPLDNIHQISEAVEDLSRAVSRMRTPYTKALIGLLGLSYIQPFEDGNKRTSRLMANALLLAHRCAPLSYRSVDDQEYRGATLVFYELNSLVAFKKIFIEQYDFAARNYAVK